MAGEERDYYEVLGVPRDADTRTIKDAYHRLAMKWHPDRNKSPDAETRFKEIAKAYAILSDPSKRSRYDAQGFEGVAHFSQDDLFRNVDLGSIFGDLGFGFGPGGDSIFDRMFGTRRQRQTRGVDLEVRIQVSLERINEGGKETVHFLRPVACAACNGYGTKSGKAPSRCKVCSGTGHQVSTRKETQQKGSVTFQQVTTCPACSGRGVVVEKPCHKCAGSGHVNEEEVIKVHIPAGLDEGKRLRIPGYGLPAEEAGCSAGDLLVQVFSVPDARFQRLGADLWRAESIDISDAVLGTRRIVPTLDGEVDVKVPAGTQPDEVLRLRGKGLPRASGERGDLNLRMQVQIPKQLTQEESELFQKLRALHSR